MKLVPVMACHCNNRLTIAPPAASATLVAAAAARGILLEPRRHSRRLESPYWQNEKEMTRPPRKYVNVEWDEWKSATHQSAAVTREGEAADAALRVQPALDDLHDITEWMDEWTDREMLENKQKQRITSLENVSYRSYWMGIDYRHSLQVH